MSASQSAIGGLMFRMEVFSSRIRATEAKIAGIETITAVPSIPRITDSCILKPLMKFRAFPAARISLPLASDLTGTSFVTMTVIPEPNFAALFGSFGILALLRRRR